MSAAAAAALSWLCAWLVRVSCLSLRSGLVVFFTDNAMTVDVGERRLVRSVSQSSIRIVEVHTPIQCTLVTPNKSLAVKYIVI